VSNEGLDWVPHGTTLRKNTFISNPVLSGEKSALLAGEKKQISLFVRNDSGIFS
jgi:hypothetical protein